LQPASTPLPASVDVETYPCHAVPTVMCPFEKFAEVQPLMESASVADAESPVESGTVSATLESALDSICVESVAVEDSVVRSAKESPASESDRTPDSEFGLTQRSDKHVRPLLQVLLP
jgi:hypothetical protein